MPYKDPAKRAAVKRRWHERHPTWRRDWKRANPLYNRLRKYDLTPETYTTMLQQQDHRCAICGSQEPLVIDHCHTSQHIRALLCNGCNSALGFLREDPERARALADYVEHYA